MRLGTVDGRLVIVTGNVIGGSTRREGMLDVAQQSGGKFGPDPLTAIERWDEFTDWAERTLSTNHAVAAGERVEPAGDARTDNSVLLGPPVPRPRQVFAVALNYAPHASEAGSAVPQEPLVFTKFPTSITGPVATVELSGDRVDWEVELVAVIAREGYRIPVAAAWDHVAGLMVGQDISDRTIQLMGSPAQFSLGKSFPGYGPTGPVLVTRDAFDDPGDLEITCSIGSTVLQKARTSEMLFPVPELVARLSSICRLLPGDLIFTGTPAGVGNRMHPPRFLKNGDRLVSYIEGIGDLVTDLIAPLEP